MTNTPLKGFLTSESDADIRLDVPGGTWVVQRSDVEEQAVWHNPTVPGAHGRPVEIVVRPGAKIDWLQSVTLKPLERPMTLPDRYAKVVGSESLSQLSEDWGRTHGFAFDASVAAEAGHTSVSCWDDPSGFGTICQGDDCQ